jgi:hypothetical protein
VKGGIRIYIKSERRDPDPHQSDRRDPGIYIKVKGGIWISIKVMQTRNTPYHTKNKITEIGQKMFITKERCHHYQDYHKTFKNGKILTKITYPTADAQSLLGMKTITTVLVELGA